MDDRIVASALPCLVDATVLVEAARCGALEPWCGEDRIAVAELVLASVARWRDEAGEAHAIDLARLVADGRIEVMRATAAELKAVMRWVRRGGLSDGELESVAIVLAGRGRLWTRDRVLRRVLHELGIEHRLVAEAIVSKMAPMLAEEGREDATEHRRYHALVDQTFGRAGGR